MKKIFVFISLTILFYTQCHCQNSDPPDSTGFKRGNSKPSDSNTVFSKVETEAQFNAAENSWNDFLKKHINYDIAIFNDAPRGKYIVKVKFTVFKDGHLGDFVALTRFGYGMEKEVIRTLKKSPNWKPAMQNGEFVNSYKTQTVVFAVEVL